MHLVILNKAKRDLAEIKHYISERSGGSNIGQSFVEELVEKCQSLAKAPFRLGHARDELQIGLRSYAYGNYVIFFRYHEEVMEVITIIEGHRDIKAIFHDR